MLKKRSPAGDQPDRRSNSRSMQRATDWRTNNNYERIQNTSPNPKDKKDEREKVEAASQAVTVAHDKAIGQHTFMEDGKNHKADDAEIFPGLPVNFNAGVSIRF